jgi:xyloglucan 6-xylosyltransferase
VQEEAAMEEEVQGDAVVEEKVQEEAVTEEQVQEEAIIEEQGQEEAAVEEQVQEEEEEEVLTWVEGDRFFTKNPYYLGITVTDWDEQRREWMANSPNKRDDGKPDVLLITGSQPAPCPHPEGDHFHLRALKNKIDYARMQNFDIFYCFSFLDPLFTGVWAKLPIIRSLMLSHPEKEWLMWMDSDAIFTDMLFEIPFHVYDDYNMVLWAWMDGVENKDWVAVNDGVFLLRNCQWSLNLLDKWSPLGPLGKIRDEAGKFLSEFLTNRRGDYPADDQSALMYVMLTDKEVMDKVKLIENEYKLHGYWVDIVPNYEKYMRNFHPGLGDCRWPFVTHFTGCSPCRGENNPTYPLEMCLENFHRAFNFADNQIMAYLGYQHKDLSSVDLVRVWNETTDPLQHVGVNPWEDRIAQVAAAALPGDCYSF